MCEYVCVCVSVCVFVCVCLPLYLHLAHFLFHCLMATCQNNQIRILLLSSLRPWMTMVGAYCFPLTTIRRGRGIVVNLWGIGSIQPHKVFCRMLRHLALLKRTKQTKVYFLSGYVFFNGQYLIFVGNIMAKHLFYKHSRI